MHELKFDENSSDTSTPLTWWQAHATKIVHPQKVCWFLRTSLPTLTTTTAGSVWWWATMSFITSSLALKIITFSFLLCVPLLTDSRWESTAHWGAEACHCLHIWVPLLIACGQAWLLCFKQIVECLSLLIRVSSKQCCRTGLQTTKKTPCTRCNEWGSYGNADEQDIKTNYCLQTPYCLRFQISWECCGWIKWVYKITDLFSFTFMPKVFEHLLLPQQPCLSFPPFKIFVCLFYVFMYRDRRQHLAMHLYVCDSLHYCSFS